jgi:hypothetical protein
VDGQDSSHDPTLRCVERPWQGDNAGMQDVPAFRDCPLLETAQAHTRRSGLTSFDYSVLTLRQPDQGFESPHV